MSSEAPTRPAGYDEHDHVLAMLEDCLRATPGTWRAEVSGNRRFVRSWVLEILRLEDGATGRVLVDEAWDDPAALLRRALAALSRRND